MVLLIVLVVLGSMIPSVRRQIRHAQVNRAANVGAADFLLAQELAGKTRRPVRLTVDTTARSISLYAVTAVADSLIQQRSYGVTGAFQLSVLTAAPMQVLVLPNSMASATITVTFGNDGYLRLVRLSRAGQVRILRQ